jgi:hypothetical protein
MNTLLTVAVVCALDRREGDTRRCKFDLTAFDVLTLMGGQFVISG